MSVPLTYQVLENDLATQKQRKRRSAKVEKAVASELGGRRTFNSGAGDEKGDAEVPHRVTQTGGRLEDVTKMAFRIESKTTANPVYRLYQTDWLKLVQAAATNGQLPVFHIQLDTMGRPLDAVVIQQSFFRELFGIAPMNLGDADVRTVSITKTMIVELGQAYIPGLGWRFDLASKQAHVAVTPYDLFVSRVKIYEASL